MKSFNFLFLFILLFVISCKKELINTPAPPKLDYVLTTYSPPLVIGWANMNSFDVDSIVTYDLDLNKDSIVDMRVIIEEGSQPIITGGGPIILPYQYLQFVDLSGSRLNLDFGSYASKGDSVFLSDFGTLIYTSFIIARVYPGYYAAVPDSNSYFLPFRLKVDSQWHLGWIKFFTTGADFPPPWVKRAEIFIEEIYFSKIPEKTITIH